MPWESRLPGCKEVPGSGDPVVFRYPVRALGCGMMLLSCLLLAIACGTTMMEERVLHWFLGTPFFLGGGGLFFLGCWQLIVHRRIEIHVKAGKFVVIHRTPLGGTRRSVLDFNQLRRISMTRSLSTETEEYSDTVVIELADGGHVDLGNHSGEKGGRLASRLHELTGVPVGK
jgi:hypothetical protein